MSELNELHWRTTTQIAQQVRAETIEECERVALEQRCERGTPWDLACVAIAREISKLKDRK